ncbi:MAG TPA: hypothetical protein PLW31_13085 [Bacteroidales bacterium]|jgi:hypothetical protein|nr:hypothetical protein [Bacteroidales bacterium]HOX78959.1 hypothetical protein [Bacteroidales bacterium]HPI87085.1 hypothetical protein [Bacteroidales bacterium]HPM93537.1 hypothetical protein [Bacteroidales bacterium]
MKRIKLSKRAIILMVFSVMILTPIISFSQDIIEIQVSPNVLNLQNNGQVVTVHTEIAYWLVDAETVSMNGVAINSWKADDNGNFVAKFLMEEIVGLPGLVIGDYNELTLDGTRYDGTTFTGTDEIMVINVIPKKR